MGGKVGRIVRYREKGDDGEQLEEAVLLAGLGLEGNRHQGGERQICLLSADARGWMEEQPQEGLCFRRFKENILVDGFPLWELQCGDRFAVGGAVLRVSESAKRCFDECVLFTNRMPCCLSRGAVFAVVERGGAVRIGDAVKKYQGLS